MVKCEDQGYFKAEDLKMEDTENSPHLSNYYYFFKSPFGRIYYLKWLFWLLTWCEASWISLITVLLSFLSGQETTMKPAKLRSHSRASRLISRTCTETRRSNSLSLLLFSSQHKDRKLHFTRTDMGVPAGGSGVPSPCTPAPELELLHETSLCALCRSWVDTLKTGANRC